MKRRSRMTRVWQLLIVVLGFGLLAGLIGVSQSGPAEAAGAAPVSVVNPPLPVTGTVNATQSGPWNVGISNAAMSPVPVRDVESPLRREVSFGHFACAMAPGDFFCSNAFTVPSGERFVIELASADVR